MPPVIRKPAAPPAAARGIALVITLCLLVLITVLVVGFTASMRTERQASYSMAETERVKLVAQSALANATALLQNNIPAPAPPNAPGAAVNWAVSPGQLTLQYPGSAAAFAIPLSSGVSRSPYDPDLNQVGTVDGLYPIVTPAGSVAAPMRVAWQGILADPSQSADGLVKLPNGKPNQIVGRYAFWIDDECGKINLNTAYGKPATPPASDSSRYGVPSFNVPIPGTVNSSGTVSVGHPYSVNLDVAELTSGGALAIDRDRLVRNTAAQSLTEPAQIQSYVTGTDAAALYQKSKFFLTTYSRSPEFNAFGKARIFLTDKMVNASSGAASKDGTVGLAYVPEDSAKPTRDLTEPLAFHSDALAIAKGPALPSDKAADVPAVAAVKQLTAYLNQSWPGYTRSFVDKWGADGADGKRHADQVAWNVYGLAASGTTFNGGYSLGSYANTTAAANQAGARNTLSRFLWDGPLSGARILPAARTPLATKLFVQAALTQVDETGHSIKDPATNKTLTGNKYVVAFRVNVQIHLPKAYQGFQLYDSKTPGFRGWKFGAPDLLYITHFEATVNGRQMVWAAGAPTAPGGTVFKNDPNGEPNSYQGGIASGSGTPATTGNFIDAGEVKSFRDPSGSVYAPTAKNCDFNTWQSAGTAAFNTIFDPGPGLTPCTITNVKVRFALCGSNGGAVNVPYQICPLRDIDRGTGFEPPSAALDPVGAVVLADAASAPLVIPATDHSGYSTYTLIAEAEDPRVNQCSGDWTANPESPSTLPMATICGDYPTALADANPQALRTGGLAQKSYSGVTYDASKLAYADMSPAANATVLSGGSVSDNWKRLPGVGLLSTISTGMQPGPSAKGYPWRTLRFQKSVGVGSPAETPPDWLLTDLVAAAYNRVDLPPGQPYAGSSLPPPVTYLNSTAGCVNVNAHIFPTGQTGTDVFNLPQNASQQTRLAPLEALFKNVYRSGIQNPSPAAPVDETALGKAVLAYLEGKRGANGQADPVFYYAGEVCEVPGLADTGANDWEREAPVRLLASNMTTRSNTFSVWGIAQTVQKNPGNTSYGQFQDAHSTPPSSVADVVTGEKRFHAVIERYVWPGVDGVVGNANTDGGVTYTSAHLGASAFLGSLTNQVDATDPSSPAFEQAYQPGAAVVKYRLVSFNYLY